MEKQAAIDVLKRLATVEAPDEEKVGAIQAGIAALEGPQTAKAKVWVVIVDGDGGLSSEVFPSEAGAYRSFVRTMKEYTEDCDEDAEINAEMDRLLMAGDFPALVNYGREAIRIDDLRVQIEEVEAELPAPPPFVPTEDDKKYIAKARELWVDDDLEIDDEPKTSIAEPGQGGDAGAWVAAWVWVTDEDADVQREQECGEENCHTLVYPDDPYYATPCGTFCSHHMRDHMRECGVCASEFSK